MSLPARVNSYELHVFSYTAYSPKQLAPLVSSMKAKGWKVVSAGSNNIKYVITTTGASASIPLQNTLVFGTMKYDLVSARHIGLS